jgi:pSer/pThr/pTyr-binding forkhead associated (FHA) protein
VLGRSRRCDVLIDDDTVSRVHAELRRGDDGWYLRDLSSRNGTFVAGRPVAHAERVLPGERIQLGGCEVHLL